MEVGNIVLSAISDGTFVARPGYFGDDAAAEGHGDLFDRRGQAWLPIGCFLIRSGDRYVPVDAGMGPTESSAGDENGPCRLFGGQLTVGLRALGVERDEVTDVVCTHLHPDHVGWLFDLESRPSFPRATIWFGAGDWRYFVEGRHAPLIQGHVQQGFRSHANRTREHLWRELEGEDVTAPVRTSQSSSSAACSRAAGSAGGRDGPTGARP